MNTLGKMAAFAAVVEAGSYSAAARVLGLSRSAVSRQISSLEAFLETTLLVRTTRLVRPTTEGLAYYERCQEIVRLTERATAEMTQDREVITGLLRITAPLISHKILMPVVTSFLETHPDVKIELSYNDRYAELVEAGFDLALRVGPTEDSSLRSRKLFSVEYGVCGAPRYLKQRGVPRTPKDLSRHDWVTLGTLPNPHHWTFRRGARSSRVHVRGSLQVDTALALRDALVCGAGIANFPLFYLSDELESGALQQLLKAWRMPDSGLYVLYPDQEFLPRRTRAFVDALADRFSEVR